MIWMLDTNVAIQIIRYKPSQLLAKLTSHTVGEVLISSVSVAELWFGVAKSREPQRNGQALEQFLLPLEVVPFDERAAKVYGPLRAELERQGKLIGPLDTLIAAHALSLGATLVTSNLQEFARVPGLRVEDWAG
jgi:tRNA(fMet)-specific endonuclease VapC